MTKFAKICSLAVTVLTVLSVAAVFWFFAAAERAGAGTGAAAQERAVYSVRLEDGVLGAYSQESGDLLFSTGVNVGQIPLSDRRMLEEGIPAESLDEVLGVFEDFCS